MMPACEILTGRVACFREGELPFKPVQGVLLAQKRTTDLFRSFHVVEQSYSTLARTIDDLIQNVK